MDDKKENRIKTEEMFKVMLHYMKQKKVLQVNNLVTNPDDSILPTRYLGARNNPKESTFVGSQNDEHVHVLSSIVYKPIGAQNKFFAEPKSKKNYQSTVHKKEGAYFNISVHDDMLMKCDYNGHDPYGAHFEIRDCQGDDFGLGYYGVGLDYHGFDNGKRRIRPRSPRRRPRSPQRRLRPPRRKFYHRDDDRVSLGHLRDGLGDNEAFGYDHNDSAYHRESNDGHGFHDHGEYNRVDDERGEYELNEQEGHFDDGDREEEYYDDDDHNVVNDGHADDRYHDDD